jgi:hypothetical protein
MSAQILEPAAPDGPQTPMHPPPATDAAGVAPGGEPTRTSGPPAGDATASAVAADAPDLVRHLVLVNTGPVLTLIAAVLAGVAAAIVLAI